jgi:predicted RNase H-like nuclease
MTAVGVDACENGWVAVALHDGGELEVRFAKTISLLASSIPEAAGMAIDIPIGLPIAERRAADVEAKAFLGPRASSVFYTPIRAALEAPTHREGTATCKAQTGSGMSQQAYALRVRIFEVEAWLPSAPCPVWEIHPEVSFATLLGHPARTSKRCWAGMVERRRALSGEGIGIPDEIGDAGVSAAVDDVLDAAVAAWSCLRLIRGTTHSFPDPPEVGAGGRQVAIWA